MRHVKLSLAFLSASETFKVQVTRCRANSTSVFAIITSPLLKRGGVFIETNYASLQGAKSSERQAMKIHRVVIVIRGDWGRAGEDSDITLVCSVRLLLLERLPLRWRKPKETPKGAGGFPSPSSRICMTEPICKINLHFKVMMRTSLRRDNHLILCKESEEGWGWFT